MSHVDILTQEWEREPEIGDWERLEYYAKRVHSLDSQSLHWSFKPDFYERFAHAAAERYRTAGKILFPRLRSFRWDWTRSEKDAKANKMLAEFFLTQAPRLNTLIAEIDISQSKAVLNHLSKNCGQLEMLHFIRSWWFPREPDDTHNQATNAAETAGALAELLDANPQLKKLTLHSHMMGYRAVQRSLLSLQLLTDLNLRYFAPEFGTPDLPWLRQYDTPPLFLPAIQRLSAAFGDARSLIGRQVFRDMTSLRMSSIGEVTWTSFRTLMRDIAFSCPSLVTLHTEATVVHFLTTGPDDHDADFPPTGFALSPLRGLGQLVDLSINLYYDAGDVLPARWDFNPTDEDWLSLARGWPALSCLLYKCHPEHGDEYMVPFQPQPRASIGLIGQLIEHCPALSILDLPIHVRRQDVQSHLDSPTFKGIRFFSVVQSWIDEDCDASDVASVLQKVVKSGAGTSFYTPDTVQISAYDAMIDNAEDEDARADIMDSIAEYYSKRLMFPEADEEEMRRCKAWTNVGNIFHQRAKLQVPTQIE